MERAPDDARDAGAPSPADDAIALHDHVIIVGYGRVGSVVGERLGVGAAVVGERELANAMARSALERCGAARDADWPSAEPVSAG